MSLPIYQRVAVTDAGDVIPGAEYTVINENTGVAAPIYSDRTGATLLTAPYFADSVGTIQFFIAQGTTFRVAASGGVGTYTDRYVYGVAEAVLVEPGGSVGIGNNVASTINSQSGYADLVVGTGSGENGATIYSGSNGVLAFANGTSGISTYQGSVIYAHADNSMRFSTSATERMRITNAGELLVGTTSSPGNKFRVVTDSNNLAYLSNTAGTGVYLVSGATSWTGVSDERVKDIIEPITGAMAKFTTLRTVIGKYKTDAEGIRRPFLIAQDVQAVFPEVVDTQDDEAGTLGLQYEGLIPSMIAAMKEQQTLIEALTARITALEAK